MKSHIEEFRDWIKTANVGQTYVYHVGYLAIDRGTIINCPNSDRTLVIPNGDIDGLATLALEGFEGGKLHLFQRKIHDREYQYIAMKRSTYWRNW